jgi:hypothetical protein
VDGFALVFMRRVWPLVFLLVPIISVGEGEEPHDVSMLILTMTLIGYHATLFDENPLTSKSLIEYNTTRKVAL